MTLIEELQADVAAAEQVYEGRRAEHVQKGTGASCYYAVRAWQDLEWRRMLLQAAIDQAQPVARDVRFG